MLCFFRVVFEVLLGLSWRACDGLLMGGPIGKTWKLGNFEGVRTGSMAVSEAPVPPGAWVPS